MRAVTAFETVLYERRGAVAWITLNRPRVLNAYSVQMRDDLYQVLDAARLDNEIRAIVIQGAGDKAFCGGADLSEFLTAPSALAARRIRAQRDLWGLLRGLPQPTVAALHGYVFGSGMEIALCCDLRVAADDVVFGLPETALGILPGAGGTQWVPRTIGLARSLDMLLGDRRLRADEALEAGLVTRVVPAGTVADAAAELASRLAGYEAEPLRRAKRALREGADLALQPALRREWMLARRPAHDARPTAV